MEATDRELWRRADAIFDALIDLAPDQRQRRLAALEPPLRGRVAQLLAALEAEGPLDQPMPTLTAPAPEPVAPRALGPWRLGQEIGRGGMAVVYAAERELPAGTQRAAVKLLTAGALAADGRRRFLREQQALMRLDHPNIAAILDAGVLEDGTPWLAMERIEGERIDQHAQRMALDPAAIVRLFRQVCDAVAFAHRQLVVHRDIKPGNVLVDGSGRARLLDFGIARLLDQGQAGDSTATAWRALTRQYAAPEQFTGEDTGTAADVFGLGALLYHLLTGRPPRLAQDGADAGITRPSRAAAVADAGRQQRGRQLRGDLDAILMKALEAEPARRYEDAAALAADLDRWLERRPVLAARGNRLYRARKFVSRHRGGVAATALLAAAVAAGIAGTLWQAWRAEQAASQARLEAERAGQVRDFLASLFEAANPERAGGPVTDVRALLALARERLAAEGETAPELRADLEREIGMIELKLGDVASGRALVQQALDRWRALPGRTSEQVDTLLSLSELDYRAGRYRESLDAAREALGLLGNDAADARRRIVALARAGTAQSALEPGDAQAIDWLEQALEAARALQPPDPALVGRRHHTLGQALREAGRHPEALRHLEQAFHIAESQPDLPPSDRLGGYWELVNVLARLQQFERARELGDRAVAIAREVYPPGHYRLAQALSSQGLLLAQVGEFERATDLLEEAVAILRDGDPSLQSRLANALFNLASVHEELGRDREAAVLLAEVQAMDEAEFGPDHGYTLSDLTWRGRVLARAGDPAARALFDEAESRLRRRGTEPAWDIHVQTAAIRLADYRVGEGEPGAALPWVDAALAAHASRGDGPNPTLAFAHTVRMLALERDGGAPAELRQAMDAVLQAAEACADEAILDLVRAYLELARVALDAGDEALARRVLERFDQRRGERPVQPLWTALHGELRSRLDGEA